MVDDKTRKFLFSLGVKMLKNKGIVLKHIDKTNE